MTMDELKLVVASKLIKLRQEAGMTQAELGERLNYSDKTVSKWERAESIPDAYVLTQLASIYGVSVDYLLSEAEPWQDPVQKAREQERASAPTFSARVVTVVAIAGIWTMAVILFVIFWLALDSPEWLIFGCALPVSVITLLVLNSIWNKGRGNRVIVMLLVASIVLLIYLFLLRFSGVRSWQLFLILIPAELVTFFSFSIQGRGAKRLKNQELSDS